MNLHKIPPALLGMTIAAASTVLAQIPTSAAPTAIVSTSAEPVAGGQFQPAWQSFSR